MIGQSCQCALNVEYALALSFTRMMLDGKKHLYLLISLFISHCGLSPHFPDSSLGKSGWERYYQDFSQSRV